MKPLYPSIPSRLLGLIYESLLIAAVGFCALLLSTLFIVLLPSIPRLHPLITAVTLLISWYIYCHINWSKKEQTIAMKTWHLQLKDHHGNRLSKKHITLRFIWAVFFWLMLPSINYLALRYFGVQASGAFYLSLLWWFVPISWLFVTPQHQLLYDVLSDTMVLKTPKNS